MRRHELYIENYCTSRVILHEAQPSAIFLYECNNFRYTTKCKSHFCFISYLGERTKVKKKIDLKIKTIFVLLLPIPFNPFQLALIKTIAAMPVQACDWLTSWPAIFWLAVMVVNRCILPLYIDKYTTANSFVLSPRYDIISRNETAWVVYKKLLHE